MVKDNVSFCLIVTLSVLPQAYRSRVLQLYWYQTLTDEQTFCTMKIRRRLVSCCKF